MFASISFSYLIVFCLNILTSVKSSDDFQIVTNNVLCTQIGWKLLKKGATVPEIFIAVSACEGLVNPQDAGLGGGFQLVMHNKTCNSNGKELYINARETAPSYWPEPRSQTDFGGVGIPGVLKGYETLFRMTFCGYQPKLKWHELFEDVIHYATTGINLSKTFKIALTYLNIKNLYNKHFFEIQGNKLLNPQLARTFAIISKEGPESSMYTENGFLLNEIIGAHPILNEKDFINFKAKILKPMHCSIDFPKKLYVHTTKLPGSGVCICAGVKILSKLYERRRAQNLNKMQRILMQQQVLRYIYALKPHIKRIKASKIYAQTDLVVDEIEEILINGIEKSTNVSLPSHFGNIYLPNYEIKSPYGTTNVVIRHNGVTLTATSTINYSFGSKILLNRLGFFLNNQLYDFSYEAGHPNYPMPSANPQSAISGTIITDQNGDVVLALGGAGGWKIIGAIFQTLARSLFDNMNLNEAVNQARCLPFGVLVCEPSMYSMMRNFRNVKYQVESGYSAVTAIDQCDAVYDNRRGGLGLSSMKCANNTYDKNSVDQFNQYLVSNQAKRLRHINKRNQIVKYCVFSRNKSIFTQYLKNSIGKFENESKKRITFIFTNRKSKCDLRFHFFLNRNKRLFKVIAKYENTIIHKIAYMKKNNVVRVVAKTLMSFFLKMKNKIM